MGSGGRPGRGGDEVVRLIVTCLGENLISQELGRRYFAGFKILDLVYKIHYKPELDPLENCQNTNLHLIIIIYWHNRHRINRYLNTFLDGLLTR